MKTLCSFIALSLIPLMTATTSADNPFLGDWTTPFAVPPFDQIQLEHYKPAFEEAMKLHSQEVRAIYVVRSTPTFENTIEALDRSGAMLDRVSNVFFSMKSSMNNDTMEALAKEFAPLLSKHEDEIRLNELLFQRVKAVYDTRNQLTLTPEQSKLLEETYKSFVRGGANLPPEKKEQLKEINAQLSVLSVKFGENVLKEENRFELVLDQESDLAGLPANVIAGAADTAKERGHAGKWVFTLHKPSMIPFLQYSDRRELREKIYQAYINRGNHDDELDNKAILGEIAMLRAKRSKLLGYETHAHYVLEENMAKVPENVYKLLHEIWDPALRRAKEEVAEMQAMIDRDGGGFQLASWDWWYYAEKVKKAKYDLDEEMLRPYFKLENVRQGVFDLATRLYGLQVHAAHGHSGLPSRRVRVRGQGSGRNPCRNPVRGLFPAGQQTRRSLDGRAAPAMQTERPGHPAGHLQCRQLLETHLRQAFAAVAGRSSRPCSTNSDMPCTDCCRTAPTRRLPVPTLLAISWNCRRRSWRTGPPNHKC